MGAPAPSRHPASPSRHIRTIALRSCTVRVGTSKVICRQPQHKLPDVAGPRPPKCMMTSSTASARAPLFKAPARLVSLAISFIVMLAAETSWPLDAYPPGRAIARSVFDALAVDLGGLTGRGLIAAANPSPGQPINRLNIASHNAHCAGGRAPRLMVRFCSCSRYPSEKGGPRGQRSL